VQPWSNGRVGTLGLSYLGTVQWLAAREKPPHLACMAPTAAGGRWFEEFPYMGGAFSELFALSFANEVAGRIDQENNLENADWPKILAHRPLLTADTVLGRTMPLYRDWLSHSSTGPYWDRLRFTPKDFASIDIPTLTVTGWYDGDQPGALFYWRGLMANAPHRDRHFLIVGPWRRPETFRGGSIQLGDTKFSSDSIVDTKATHLAKLILARVRQRQCQLLVSNPDAVFLDVREDSAGPRLGGCGLALPGSDHSHETVPGKGNGVAKVIRCALEQVSLFAPFLALAHKHMDDPAAGVACAGSRGTHQGLAAVAGQCHHAVIKSPEVSRGLQAGGLPPTALEPPEDEDDRAIRRIEAVVRARSRQEGGTIRRQRDAVAELAPGGGVQSRQLGLLVPAVLHSEEEVNRSAMGPRAAFGLGGRYRCQRGTRGEGHLAAEAVSQGAIRGRELGLLDEVGG
jgi:hypothetical protein